MINNRQGGRRRGRGGGSGGPPRSNNPGPGNRQDNRQRGNAAQLLEKYKGMARDAQMQGDRVQTETYLQYADHYFRVLNESRARFEEQRPRQRDEYGDEDDGEDNEGGREADDRFGHDRYANDRDEDGDDEPNRQPEARREPEPRRDREPRPERPARAARPERSDAPDRAAERPERAERTERNGEFRTSRRPRAARPDADGNQAEERIALDVLPPAISPANESGDETVVRVPRPRRPRRPTGDDEDIAPAA